MRSRDIYLWVLFAGVLSSALYFTVRFTMAWVDYFPLQATAKGQIAQWEIEEKDDHFFVQANYLFGEGEKGSCRFKNKFSSQAAALADLKERARQECRVWYAPGNPKYSALERDFPYNLLFRMIICYGIGVYFFFLIRKIRSVEL